MESKINKLIANPITKKKTTIEIDQELYDRCINICHKYYITFTAFLHAALSDSLTSIKVRESSKAQKE